MDVIPDVMSLLSTFLHSNFTPESIRAVCTFVLTTFGPGSCSFEWRRIDYKHKTALLDESELQIKARKPSCQGAESNDQQMRIRVHFLRMIYDMINEPLTQFSQLFLNSVTCRWFMVLFFPSLDTETVILASQILTKLLVCGESSAIPRFKEAFAIIGRLAGEHCKVTHLAYAWMAMVCNVDLSLISSELLTMSEDCIHANFPLNLPRKQMLSMEGLQLLLTMVRQRVFTLDTQEDEVFGKRIALLLYVVDY